jgi:hypothetical protein
MDGERMASINVETQYHSVMLKYRSRSYGEDWSDVEQRIAVAWTPCRFGGERPWFVCSVRSNGVYCGRRVTKLYRAGRLFACRNCYRLAYASQQESLLHRGLGKSRKIRMRQRVSGREFSSDLLGKDRPSRLEHGFVGDRF